MKLTIYSLPPANLLFKFIFCFLIISQDAFAFKNQLISKIEAEAITDLSPHRLNVNSRKTTHAPPHIASISQGMNVKRGKASLLRMGPGWTSASIFPFVGKLLNGSIGNSGSTYFLTRILFLRSLAFIHVVAFSVALLQNKQLIGNNGITPATKFLQVQKDRFGEGKMWSGLFYKFPTLFWWADWAKFDRSLDLVAIFGLFLSSTVFYLGAANVPILLCLWILYHTLVTVGQVWYGFGWESQLLETTFLSIFLCPLVSLDKLPNKPVPWVCIWGFRWLIFRIMIGAGLIKIRGDSCWRDLSAMDYHYETQPVPNPLSYFLHKLPKAYHRFETAMNHVVELIFPWLILVPHRISFVTGGILQILFQAVLITSGNLSFLNWLTMLPAIFCLDDQFLTRFFPTSTPKAFFSKQVPAQDIAGQRLVCTVITNFVHFALLSLLVWRSIPVVRNLLSKNQVMNTSFDPLRIVNTYGAFGSVTRDREEIIIQGTSEYKGLETQWLEYEFKVKPGDVSRRPPIISPYHYRLDWMMWIAARTNAHYNPWMYSFLLKLLQNDKNICSLLEKNPFDGKNPPKYVRAMIYHYQYTDSLTKGEVGDASVSISKRSVWWKREEVGTYIPMVGVDSLVGKI